MIATTRLLLAAAGALALAACADGTPTASRSAQPGAPLQNLGVSVLCTGSANSAFSPAVTDSTQPVAVTTDRGYTCTLGATGGTVSSTVTRPALDCISLLESVGVTDEVVTWTGGSGPATSTIRYTSVTGAASGATFQGTVIAGRHQGQAVLQVLVITGAQGTGVPQLCPAGLGTISEYSGTLTFKILDTTV